MRAFLKVLVILTGLALITLSVLALVLIIQFDALGRAGFERGLTYALGSPTTIDAVDFSPLEGRIALRGLTVANPAGFKKAPAMRLNLVTIEFAYPQLLSRTPTIRRVTVHGGTIDLRYKLTKGCNLARLARQAARFASGGLAARHNHGLTEAKDAESTWSKLAPLAFAARGRFVIQEFRCDGLTVALDTNLLPRSSVTVQLEPFTLKDVSKRGPVNAGEVTVIFLRSLLTESLRGRGLLTPVAGLLRREITRLPNASGTKQMDGGGSASPMGRLEAPGAARR